MGTLDSMLPKKTKQKNLSTCQIWYQKLTSSWNYASKENELVRILTENPLYLYVIKISASSPLPEKDIHFNTNSSKEYKTLIIYLKSFSRGVGLGKNKKIKN